MPNRLVDEKSPYLRQHADNPVDWMPWGAEAFARAKAEDKPVFLSIGYSTCHWCHVMAHESFENAGVAEVLNAHFIPIKVDREERPDVDRVYMTYVQQTTGHGGWPMSVWLTPDLKPFFGGTYFPVDDRHGRPGFLTVLRAIERHWREQRGKIENGAEEVVQALRRYAAEGGAREVGEAAAATPPLHEAAGEAFERCFQYFYESHDATWGGFGGAPKFPRASVVSFLFRVAAIQGRESEAGVESVRMAAHTLQRMAEGGLHDHVGGGFHRYSVDEKWFVPHFEKMLYDQAQIAMNLLEARQATGREVFAWIARDIFEYVARDLTAPGGAFYSAEDADSLLAADGDEHAEGAFYAWTRTEIEAVLGADAKFLCDHFGVKEGGNVDHDPQGEFRGKNVLMQRQSLATTAKAHGIDILEANDLLVGCLARLRGSRAKRPRPHLDDKVIAAWNGLMISALARGAQVLGAGGQDGPAFLERAVRAAGFVRRELYDDAGGTLYRSWREGRSEIGAFAEDYAFLIQGLLDLYEAGFDVRWLQWAETLQARMDALFWDEENGGYFSSRADDASVIVRLKEDYDGAEPSAGSVAVSNLLRLDWMIGLGGARDRALRTVEAFRRQWARVPHALPQMLCSMEMALAAPRTVVLAGDPAGDEFRALAAVLHERIGPRFAILCADGGAGQRWLAEKRGYLSGFVPRKGVATAYVCEDYSCRQPVSDPAELRESIG